MGLRIIMLVIGFCWCSTQVLAQNDPAVARLQAELARTPADTHRVSVLSDLAWALVDDDSDKAIAYVTEATQLAQKLGFVAGEATAWSIFGTIEQALDNLEMARDYHQKALTLRQQLNDPKALAASLNNLGTVFEGLADYDAALNHHNQSLRIVERLRDSTRVARSHINIAGVYEGMGIYLEALNHVNTARAIFEARNNRDDLAEAYGLLGHIRFELGDFEEAHNWYTQSLTLYKTVGDAEGEAGALRDVGNALDELGNVLHSRDTIMLSMGYYQQSLRLHEELGDSLGMAAVYNNMGVAHKHLGTYDEALKFLTYSLRIRQRYADQVGIMEVYNSIGDVYFRKKEYALALRYTAMYQQVATMIRDGKYEQKSYKDFSKIYAATGDFKNAYLNQVKYDDLRYKRLDEARARELTRREVNYLEERNQREITRKEAELARRDAEIQRAVATRNALIGGATALALLVVFIYNRAQARARSNRQLAIKNAAIERERKRADELLANILPESAARELKANNTVKPIRYDSVTVLFTDFKGFTQVAEVMSPEDLIEELDECFRMFDAIVLQFGLEKIKTIGDSYMCAGGLPTPNTTHPLDTVRAAIEMQRQLQQLMQRKAAEGKPVFEMRVGIHTGPVVAGVVGSHKFAYDIWGDTVNTAARMEQGSESHRINVSGTTAELIQGHFNCTYRGDIAAKNKGKIAMYFVEV
jgi:adenylate cyclase